MKGCGFLSFAENIGKNVSKSVAKNVSNKYSQKLLDHTKQSATDTFKTASKRAIQNAVEATSDLIGSKIADVVAKSYAVAKSYNDNSNKITSNPETASQTEEIPKEDIQPQKIKNQLINELRLI